ncbi:MAG: SRPBCC family protein [Dehalococcoidia bacterium]|nr:SRPBCC family protein [Dehalococcoidia bacterium]
MRIACEDEIARPPETVFPWIAEPEKAMKWQRNVKGGEIIVDKPEKIGTTFREVIEEDGKTLEMHGTITRYVENRTMGFHIVSKIHELDVMYSIEAKGNGTKIKIEASIRWKFPMNIVSLLVRRKMEERLVSQLKSELQDLKRLCEGA